MQPSGFVSFTLTHHTTFASFSCYPSSHIQTCRPNVWFSSVFILCGAAIIAVMLTQAGNQVEESASMSMFDSLQRRSNYEEKMSRDNPWHVRAHAFLAYNAAYLITIFIWVLWMGFIMVWSMLEVPEWDFGSKSLKVLIVFIASPKHSQYFSLQRHNTLQLVCVLVLDHFLCQRLHRIERMDLLGCQ